MNLEPLRRLQSKTSAALVAAAAFLLASCGGGGASSSPTGVGSLQLLPGTGSIYAGVPYTFNIAGGRAPYLVTSSEQTLVELNFTTSSNQFTFVARNPGVIDTGLDPNEVPRRTVNIQVRDSNGTSISNEYSVLQNFFTGYSVAYSSFCIVTTTGPALQACSGGDTVISFFPVSQGTLYGGREFQLDRIRGDFSFVPEPPGNSPQLVDRMRVRTDHEGKAFARLRVAVGAPTQLASYSLTDVATGATTNYLFLIMQGAPIGTITVLPGGPVEFTGPNSGTCGFGSADQFVFDGTAPYTLIPSPGIGVNPTTLAANGDRFTITVGQGFPVTACPNGTVIVQDAQGRRASVNVTSKVGATSIPITVAPLPLPALTCTVNTTQAAVVGGNGPLQVVSNHPRVFATVSGNVLSVLRAGSGDGATIYPTTASLAITDGSTLNATAITITVPANCP
ncbi:MAG TPA: hypothetical protein PLO00_09475 [Usitatibacteraceae bacterium]|nr:hypothetical protein [Usitatibacteraceae bacterium]HQY47780.1 hypothetical protein [Usitatibacteraceae bacterium]